MTPEERWDREVAEIEEDWARLRETPLVRMLIEMPWPEAGAEGEDWAERAWTNRGRRPEGAGVPRETEAAPEADEAGAATDGDGGELDGH